MSPVTTPAPFVVFDESRQLHFTGTLLGEATTHETEKRRWTDMALYRTAGGSYVLHIIGRSSVRGEVDIHSGRVCEDAAAVVLSLHRTDDNGVQFLSTVARDLLHAAAQLDYDIAEEYGTQHID